MKRLIASSASDIAITALEKEISGLELSIGGLEKWLWISSAAVAVGVIFEIVFLVHEHLEDRANWLRGILIPPSLPSFRWLLFEIASVLLVVAGIVGELWVGVISSTRNADLRSKNNRLVGLINQRSSEATERASNADLMRVELENRIVDFFGPRELTAEQSARIAKRLLNLAGRRIDVFVLAIGNPYSETESLESIALARALTRTLSSAHLDADGWVVKCPNAYGSSNLVINVVGNTAKNLVAALEIVNALTPELGTYPIVEADTFGNTIAGCDFSDVDTFKPNKGKHDAPVSITVGRKITPILTREMLEPTVPKSP